MGNMKFKVIESFDLTEMARIGWVPVSRPKSVEVYIHTDDSGKIPHFHIRKYSKEGKFDRESCIRIDSPEYFFHGQYRDRISTALAKQLDKKLRTVDENSVKGSTYWEKVVDAWNDNNSDVKVPKDAKQPDYTQLNGRG